MPAAECDRILGLPIKHEATEEDADLFSSERLRPEVYEAGERLNKYQAGAAREYLRTGGGYFPMAPGAGKTLLAFTLANEAYLLGIKRSLYLIPASAAHQTWNQQLPIARKWLEMAVPVEMLSGQSRDERFHRVRARASGLYIMSYSQLSRPDTNDLLAALQPELVICDEAHRLKHKKSALTKRVFAMIAEFKCQLVTMSGTFASKGIEEIHHHLVTALHEKAPVPKNLSVAMDWAQHIDSAASSTMDKIPSSMIPLVDWARKNFPQNAFGPDVESLRRAFRLRLNSAPGVVATREQSSGASLTIFNQPIEDLERSKGWDQVTKLWKDVDLGTTPDGDAIAHAIQAHRWKRYLTMGFYYSLKWPTVEHMLRYRMAATAEEAAERIAKSKSHHALENAYNKLLREFLKEAPLGLDTPFDVGRSIAQHRDTYVPGELVDAHDAMLAADFPGRLQRIKNPVYLAEGRYPALVEWARHRPKDDPGGIAWYHHFAVGKRAIEALREAGVDSLWCPAGNEANQAIADPSNVGKVIVASMKAHSEGKNLQAFGAQIMLETPRDANLTEQMISRTLRQGQKRDEIDVTTLLTTQFDHMLYAAMLQDSLFAHQALGQHRKVVTATYSPLPQVFSSTFLREQGLEPRMLDRAQKEMLRLHFGEVVL